MRDGSIGGGIDLLSGDFLASAARALGASAPKGGHVGVDTIVYMNEILGLTEDGASQLPRLYQDVREEVKGVIQINRKWFLDYSAFGYDRHGNFMTLPDPAYIPADDPVAGMFEYTVDNGDGSYAYTTGYMLDVVPELAAAPDLTGSMLKAFALAADDTRAVINFMHTWPVLGDSFTPIPCGASTPDFYDLSISERSGLQVPVRMAAAGDGREGSITVENGGPATANEVRIMVTGEYQGADGLLHRVQLLDGMNGVPIFLDPITVSSIEPGYSATLTFFFIMDESATITWKAVAEADADVNTANNRVTEYTIVRKPKGGGGGGRGH